MTKRNREKRKADRLSISIYTPIGDDENSTIGDIIASDFSIEKEVFEDGEEEYSRRMLLYLNRLSNLQKEILRLNISGHLPREIREELHISEKEYADCYSAIKSYKNTKYLAKLIRRKSVC